VSVDTIKLLTSYSNVFLKTGSIFEINFWSISEISENLDVIETKPLSWRILLRKKMNHTHTHSN